ncbi:MAG: NAD(P)H-hydrate dehydratase, partial [Gemmobacter sp.]
MAPPDAMPTDPTHPDLDALRGRLAKRAEGFKYTYGHALILAGGPGQGGAARLAARGALRIGAGLVTLGCPLPALAENSARMDTVMLRAVHDGAALTRVLDDARYNALCLGPGIGFERARELVPIALGSGRGVVVDADALSAYATDPDALFALCTPQTVLTPHGGEFARLFP